jgi:hypothetical protein
LPCGASYGFLVKLRPTRAPCSALGSRLVPPGATGIREFTDRRVAGAPSGGGRRRDEPAEDRQRLLDLGRRCCGGRGRRSRDVGSRRLHVVRERSRSLPDQVTGRPAALAPAVGDGGGRRASIVHLSHLRRERGRVVGPSARIVPTFGRASRSILGAGDLIARPRSRSGRARSGARKSRRPVGSCPAGAAGLEPATPGFGDRCSAS